MFTLTVFEILLFKAKSVLSPAQRGIGTEKVKKKCSIIYVSSVDKFLLKKPQNLQNLTFLWLSEKLLQVQ